MSEARVLVVGAGPVGLTTALALSRMGTPCRIVDRAPQRTSQSRAAVIHARTLELFERLGIIDPFLKRGVTVHGGTIHGSGSKVLARMSLDGLPTAYHYFLGLEQAETERLLTDALSTHQVMVERPVELLSFSQEQDRVLATLRRGDGREEQVAVDYLIGCDGAHSTTRHHLGLKLLGDTEPETWVTADVRIDWQHPRDEVVAWLTNDGFLFIAPMNDDRWRIVASTTYGKETAPAEFTLEDVQRLCSQRVEVPLRLHDPTWISPFTINTRLAERLRVGRVFLAGDAAHVHSPAGGQGMNTGIQDGLNLAWKIALVLEGARPEPLLESFQSERHANAARLLAGVGPVTKMAALRHPLGVAMRNTFISFMNQFDLVRERLERGLSELDVQYRRSPIVGEWHQGIGEWLSALVRHEPHPTLTDCWDFGKGPHPGERAADAWGLRSAHVDTQRLFQTWQGDLRHQLLLFSGLHPNPARLEQLRGWLADLRHDQAKHWSSVLILPVLDATPESVADATLLDVDGDAHHHYGARYECLYLIRPDGYVAFRSQPVDLNHLRDYWQRTLFAS